MKRTLIVIFLLSSIFALFAGNVKFGAGLTFAFPTGGFGDASGSGIGATVKAIYPFSTNLFFTGSVGYIAFGGKEYTENTYYGTYKMKMSYADIPIVGGVNYFFNGSDGFYGLGELGMHMLHAKWEQTYAGNSESDSDSDTKMGFAPGAGYTFTFNNLKIDLNAKYNLVQDDFNFFSVNAGVNF